MSISIASLPIARSIKLSHREVHAVPSQSIASAKPSHRDPIARSMPSPCNPSRAPSCPIVIPSRAVPIAIASRPSSRPCESHRELSHHEHIHCEPSIAQPSIAPSCLHRHRFASRPLSRPHKSHRELSHREQIDCDPSIAQPSIAPSHLGFSFAPSFIFYPPDFEINHRPQRSLTD